MKLNIRPFDPCEEGLEYYKSKASFEQAWNACDRGDWMLWLADKLEVDDRVLTRAAALCADTVRHLMKDERSTAAVDAALRYAAGKISRKELNKYSDYAQDAYRDADAVKAYYAARAAYSVTCAAYCAAYWAACAAYWAAYWAADCSTHSAHSARSASLMETAAICRETLTEAVFEKVKQLNEK